MGELVGSRRDFIRQNAPREGRITLIETPIGAAALAGADVAAHVFLTSGEQLEIFERCLDGLGVRSRQAKTLADEYSISVWAIAARTKEASSPGEDLQKVATAIAEGRSDQLIRIGQVENTELWEYRGPFLDEQYRSPSRGGKTRALHMHIIVIDGISYSWRALGAKKCAFKGDRINFRYAVWPVADKTYHRVLPNTFTALDKDGKIQERGLRGWKRQLRTARQKAPTAGHERDDN